MAVVAIRWTDQLDDGLVLAPERYNPRIRQHDCAEDAVRGKTIAELANLSRDTLQPKRGDASLPYIVLDTGDAKNGVISAKLPTGHTGIGSAKKILSSGDVIISRLRPYLRQVGFVDRELSECGVVVASTEFYVLRPKDEQSIAFLIGFLLSEKVQTILAASQEGGHHPRFPEKTLLGLFVPDALLTSRVKLSREVEDATDAARRAERLIADSGRSVAKLLAAAANSGA